MCCSSWAVIRAGIWTAKNVLHALEHVGPFFLSLPGHQSLFHEDGLQNIHEDTGKLFGLLAMGLSLRVQRFLKVSPQALHFILKPLVYSFFRL